MPNRAHVQYQILAATTTLFAWSSAIAALWIMYSSYSVLKRNKKHGLEHAPSFLIKQVFWMSFCDTLIMTQLGLIYIPVAVDKGFLGGMNHATCTAVGMTVQFIVCGSVGWNIIICICLLRILLGGDISKIDGELVFHHFYVWIQALLAAIIPLIGDAYGYIPNPEVERGFTHFQCWIAKTHYQTSLFIICIGAFAFAIVLLIFTVIHKCAIKRAHSGLTPIYSTAYIKYTIVFTISWFWPFLLRIIQRSTTLPTVLIWLHHISFASYGLGNAWVWGSSTRLTAESQLAMPPPVHKTMPLVTINALKLPNNTDKKLLNGTDKTLSINDETVTVTLSPVHSHVSAYGESEKEAIALLRASPHRTHVSLNTDTILENDKLLIV